MKRLFLIVTILSTVALHGFAANYVTGSSAPIGGVTLFDDTSPLVGLNNPGLLVSYGEKEVDLTRIFRGDITGYKAGYKFGRIFLPSLYSSVNFSQNTIEAFDDYLPIVRGLIVDEEGKLPIDRVYGSIDLVEVAKILTLGTIDLEPLFATTATVNEVQSISNYINALINGDKPGVYNFINMNLLGFYRHNFGFSIYFHSDVLVGLTSDSRNLMLVNDPEVDLNIETGLALTIGFGERNIPLIGKADLGATMRMHVLAQAHAGSIDDILTLVGQVQDYIGVIDSATSWQDYLDFSAFGDGSLFKAGVGASIDLGIVKKVARNNITIAAKLSDVISPVYWFNSSSLGWILPDLSFGFKYTLPISDKWWMLINDPSFYFQLDDMLYTYPVSFLSKIHLGFDTKLFFDFLQIGAGINQGYVTAGFSVHITPAILAKIPILKYLFYATAPVTFFNLEYYFNIYGQELGQYPGESGYQGYGTGVDIYIGF